MRSTRIIQTWFTNNYSGEAIRVQLTGYDIPGATLRAPFEGQAIQRLKRWLLKKSQRVTRH